MTEPHVHDGRDESNAPGHNDNGGNGGGSSTGSDIGGTDHTTGGTQATGESGGGAHGMPGGRGTGTRRGRMTIPPDLIPAAQFVDDYDGSGRS
jgi:hypothetical protein